MFLVLAKHSGDDNGLATYKNNVPTGGNVVINYPVPSFTNSTYGRKIALSAVNTDIYNAGLTSNTSIYGDGLRHTLATTASNPGGGWASLVGKLFIDGVNTGITTTGVPTFFWAGDYNVGFPGTRTMNGIISTYLTVGGDVFSDPQGTAYTFAADSAANLPAEAEPHQIYYAVNSKCNGEAKAAGGGNNKVSIRMKLEGGGIYCLNN
jgi:hypothetical protein